MIYVGCFNREFGLPHKSNVPSSLKMTKWQTINWSPVGWLTNGSQNGPIETARFGVLGTRTSKVGVPILSASQVVPAQHRKPRVDKALIGEFTVETWNILHSPYSPIFRYISVFKKRLFFLTCVCVCTSLGFHLMCKDQHPETLQKLTIFWISGLNRCKSHHLLWCRHVCSCWRSWVQDCFFELQKMLGDLWPIRIF